MQYFIFTIIAFMMSSMALACGCNMEVGTMSVNRTFSNNGGIRAFNFTTFQQTYDTAPIVVLMPTNQGGDPSTIRITDVATNGFWAAAVEPSSEDGPHVAMTNIGYIAIESGNCVLSDGTKIEAGTLSYSNYQGSNGSGALPGSSWSSVSWSTSFTSAPVVLHMVQTMNSETNLTLPPGNVYTTNFPSSSPWITSAINNITASGADFAMELSQVAEIPGSAETLGYIAFDPVNGGSFYDTSNIAVNFDAFVTAPNIDGWNDNCNESFTYPTINAGSAIPIARKRARPDIDGGWIRRCGIFSNRVTLTMDEDQSTDNERNHTTPTEAASLVVFNRPFAAEVCEVDLQITKDVDNVIVNEDGTLTYTITVENNGPDTATGIVIEDILPNGISIDGTIAPNPNPSTGTVTVTP